MKPAAAQAVDSGVELFSGVCIWKLGSKFGLRAPSDVDLFLIEIIVELSQSGKNLRPTGVGERNGQRK